MKQEARISIALVCIVLGFMVAVQFKTTAANPGDLSTLRVQDLTLQLDKVSKERDALAEEVASMREQLKEGSEDRAAEVLRQQLAKANLLAGLEAVEGPGVVVTLADSAQPLQPGENPNLYLVHDEDLLKVVNELRAAGAEAVCINEQRLVATSEIRCAGTTILVNTTKIAPPFVIKAIGDPAVLESSLRIKGGWLETLEIWGIKSQVQRVETVQVPAYRGSLAFRYAQPVSTKGTAN